MVLAFVVIAQQTLASARLRGLTMLLALLVCPLALHAQASTPGVDQNHGLFGIDRLDENEAHGIYSRPNQKRVDNLVIVAMVGTALWEGTSSPLGRAMWQSVDASLGSSLSTEALKRLFGRPRPDQDPNPRVWFRGKGHMSFPSGETALMSAFATPLILSFHDEHPAVWGLAVLPLYMGKARMASRGHWPTDVLGGAALGLAMGTLAHDREQPWVLQLTGDGAYVGLKLRF